MAKTIQTMLAEKQAALAPLAARDRFVTDELRRLGNDPNADPGVVMTLKRERAENGPKMTVLENEIDVLKVEQARDDAVAAMQRQVSPTGVRLPSYDRVARVGYEARTYRPDEDPNGKQFLLDMSRSFIYGDPNATGRLQRHSQEESVDRGKDFAERAVGTGAYAGLVVPQYLTDQYAPAVAALRPFADSCTTKHDLPPDGMTINLSRITTSTSVAIQSAENTAVSETNMDDTILAISVQTAGGQQTVSRQAIERGTGVEDVTVEDLMRRHATTLDSTLLNQATNGLTNVAQNFAYTDATPTVPELWPRLYAAQNGVEGALLGQAPPTHFVMHPRRWNWICSQTSSVWPVAGGVIPTQLFSQVLSNDYGAGVRAIMANGMLVVTDANITTTAGAGTEDEIYAVAQGESHLWEDPNAPLLIRAEQPAAGNLGVLLVVYSYFAYTHTRYTNAASKISGTGLIAPTF